MKEGDLLIKKIINIKNLGIFKDYNSPSSLPEFKRYNLIYGWNASGKTTLSKLFESLETGANKDFPDLKYKIKVSNSPSKEIKESIAYPKKIKIFNKEYIAKNVQIEEGRAKAIVFLGEDNKKLSEEIKTDEESLTKLKKELEELQKNEKKTEKAKGEIFTSVARTIGEAIGGNARRDYKKNNAEEGFDTFFNNKGVTDEILDDDQIEVFSDTCKQDIQDKLDEILTPSFHINGATKSLSEAVNTLLDKGTKLCLQKINVVAIERLKKNSDISGWVEKGLSLYKKHNSENCEFCAQEITKERLSDLESYFNEASNKAKKEINSILEKFREICNGIKNINPPDKARLYKEFQNLYQESVQALEQKRENTLEEIKDLEKVLNNKKERVSKEIELENNVSISDLLSEIEPVNNFIEQHNEKTINFGAKKIEAEDKIKKHHLANIYNNVKEKNNELQSFQNEIKKINDGSNESPGAAFLEKKIEANKSKISSVHKSCKEINEKLKAFLGRDEISFEVGEGDEFFSLKRRGEDAKYLCEGEKTAVALVYFLVSLKEKGIELSNTIIFIDDPISSLDSNSISQAFAFIKREIDSSYQVFISTHNYNFFKKVKGWLDDKRNKGCKENEKAEFFMVKNLVRDDNREAIICPLDDLIKKYNSEYQYLFSVIKKAVDNESLDDAKEWYPLPNMARKFLEIFLAFKIPSENVFSSQLSMFFKKTGFNDASKRNKIESFLNEKSHFFPNGIEGFDLDNLSECKGVLQDILLLVENTDKEHYEELKKI